MRPAREIGDALVARDRARRRAVPPRSCSRRSRRGRSPRCRPVVADDLEQSDVSIFAARAQANELGSRMQMTDIVNRRRMRHAHMVNITPQIMREGMRADFRAVDRISTQGASTSSARARTIRATTPAGSDITADARSGATAGSRRAASSRATSGATCRRRGLHDARRSQRHVRHRRRRRRLAVRSVRARSSRHAAHGDDRRQPARRRAGRTIRRCATTSGAYTHTDENSDRVGEFAIGTNIELTHVIGHILQDEKFPGVHIAFGNPYGAHTGATGTPPRTSTSSAPTSTSGWTTRRSWSGAGS